MASSLYVARELQAVTSPFPQSCFTMGFIKKQQKKSSSDSTEEAEIELRRQRLKLERAIRRSKRDAELEKRRRVLEKLNWVVWDESDDEDSKETLMVQTGSDLIADEIQRLNSLYQTNMAEFDRLIRNNVHFVPNAIKIMADYDANLMGDASQFLVNVTSLDPEFLSAYTQNGGLEILSPMLNSHDPNIQTCGIHILSNLSSCSAIAKKIVHIDSVLLATIECLYFGNRETQTIATEATANLIRYTTEPTRVQWFIEQDLVDSLGDMLSRPDSESLYLALSLLKDLYEKARKHGFISIVMASAVRSRAHVERIYNNPNQPEILSNLAEWLLVHYYDKYQSEDMIY